jgi:hypothetical protein
MEDTCDNNQRDTFGVVSQELNTILSVVAGWALSVLPSKVATNTAPGFSFASSWLLYPIRDYFGSIPNLPTRICETTMGRLTLRELAVILPVHFLVPAVGASLFQLILPASMSRHAIEPVVYAENNPWIVDVMREILINAIFTVALLAIPEILKINGIRRGFALLLLYPVYSFAVDAEASASVFGPNLIYSLRCVSKHEEVPLTQWPHMIGPIIGGVIGGKIMNSTFPDDAKRQPQRLD